MSRSGATAIRRAAILGLVLSAGMIAPTFCRGTTVPQHTTIQELQNLPVKSAVHLIGVVTYVDEAAGLFWLQDKTGAMPISVKPVPASVHAGAAVAVDGTKAAVPGAGQGGDGIALDKIRVQSVDSAGMALPAGVGGFPAQPGTASLPHTAADPGTLHREPVWGPPVAAALLALLSLTVAAMLMWVRTLLGQVREQSAALNRASETTQAIRDLSTAVLQVAAQRQFDSQVSVQGGGEIAELVEGFNTMLSELRRRERARREAEARLQHMALVDDLTGLPNRRLLADRLAQDLAKARRENRKVALLYVDLDGFKLVNDSLGHAVGDVLLGQVAQRLRQRFRHSDTLARVGSDEFALILDNLQNAADADKAAESVLEVVRPPFEIEGHSIRITASIGVSLFPDQGSEGGQLLQQADCAMYAAKRNGKNRIVQFGDGLGSAARERLTLEGELRRAIEKGEILVHYQPEFDLASNQIVRFEALARWLHPKLGPISPLTFIPLAEESGLIVPLGAFVLERACKDAMIWQRRASRPVQVAVNVSSVQFARDSFLEEVEEVLQRTGLRPSLLQLELTESATLTGVERAADLIRRLTGRGIGTAMDDFGTGYSCLSYLPRLGFDALKLDRSFVSELVVRPETRAFVQSILSMAHNLHMKVIVEGIETREQLELMKALGTNEGQGYLLGRPTPNPLEQLSWGAELWRDPGARMEEREAVR
jgi:diguanylate cyclase (GGDEF)-like protein